MILGAAVVATAAVWGGWTLDRGLLWPSPGGTAVPEASADLDAQADPDMPEAGSEPGVHRVRMENQMPYYDPAKVEVEVGDRVIWETAAISDAHTVSEQYGVFTSPKVAPDGTWCFRFAQAGTFRYGCRIHPWMRGEIVVDWPRLAGAIYPLGGLGGDPLLLPPSDARGVWILSREPRPKLLQLVRGQAPRELDVPLSPSDLGDLRPGGGGRVWSLDPSGTALLRIEPADRTVVVERIDLGSSRVSAFAANEERAIVFEPERRRFLLRDFGLGERQVDLGPPACEGTPSELALDGAGRLWWLERGTGHAGQLDLASSRGGCLALPSESALARLVPTAEGALALDLGRRKLLVLGTQGVTEIGLPAGFETPRDVAAGASGVIWLVDATGELVSRVEAGRHEIFRFPGSTLTRLAEDSGGGLWVLAAEVGLLRYVGPAELTRRLAAYRAGGDGACPPSPSARVVSQEVEPEAHEKGARHGRGGRQPGN